MNWSNTVMLILEKIMFGVILNTLWIIGVLAGLCIFGIAPATLSLSKVLNEKDLFTKDSKIKPILFSFFRHYKSEFLKANVVFGCYELLFYLLIVDYNILKETEILYSFLQIPLWVLALYILGTLVFAVPIAAVSKRGFKEKLKLIILTPILMPVTTILNIIIIVITAVLIFFYPVGTFLIFIVAGIAVISFFSVRTLRKKELIL